MKWINHLCTKFESDVDLYPTILTDLMQKYDIETMMCLLSCGFNIIYQKELQFNLFDKPVTPLESLCIRVKNEFYHDGINDDNKNINIKVFIYFIDCIMKNMKQFGGEKKVLNHIIDTGAAKIILDFNHNDLIPIRKRWVQIAQKGEWNENGKFATTWVDCEK